MLALDSMLASVKRETKEDNVCEEEEETTAELCCLAGRRRAGKLALNTATRGRCVIVAGQLILKHDSLINHFDTAKWFSVLWLLFFDNSNHKELCKYNDKATSLNFVPDVNLWTEKTTRCSSPSPRSACCRC